MPYSKVAYKVNTDKKISADVVFTLNTTNDFATDIQAQLTADVPFFLQPMIKGLAEQFLGTAMQYLKTAIEKS